MPILKILNKIVCSYPQKGVHLKELSDFLGANAASFWWYDVLRNRIILREQLNRDDLLNLEQKASFEYKNSFVFNKLESISIDYFMSDFDVGSFDVYKHNDIEKKFVESFKYIFVIGLKVRGAYYGCITFYSNSFNASSIHEGGWNEFGEVLGGFIFNTENNMEKIWIDRWKIGHELARSMDISKTKIERLRKRIGGGANYSKSNLTSNLKGAERQIVACMHTLEHGTFFEASADRARRCPFEDLVDHLETTITPFEQKYSENYIDIRMNTNNVRGIKIKMHNTDISLLLANIIENACKYTPSPGEIEVELELSEDGGLVLMVTNDSHALPKKEMSRIWSFGVRSINSDGVSGKGMGLSIVSDICKAYSLRCKLSQIVVEGEFLQEDLTRTCMRLLIPQELCRDISRG